MRRLYRLAWVALTVRSVVLPFPRQGVNGVLTRHGDVLMVQHTYGPRREWLLPGGGIHRREHPHAAARREVREELGLDALDLRPLAVVLVGEGRRRTTIHCFHAEVDPAAELRLDPVEIAGAAWFPWTDLPRRFPLYGEEILQALVAAGHPARQPAG